jgi:methylmalonyl-CoA mutase N-terminal domain/subunit
VEALTNETEARTLAIMDDIESRGGMVSCIESGYIQQLIADEAYVKQRRLEAGEEVVVGVNRYQTDDARELELFTLEETLPRKQIERLHTVRARRDSIAAAGALERLRAAANGTENLMPPLIAATEAYCTLGEMCDVLRSAFGEFREPIVV